jgi:hypothetical protein
MPYSAEEIEDTLESLEEKLPEGAFRRLVAADK